MKNTGTRLAPLIVSCGLMMACSDEATVVSCADPFPIFGPSESEIVITAVSTGITMSIAGHPQLRVSLDDSVSAIGYQFVVETTYPIMRARAGLFERIQNDRREFASADTFWAVPWAHDEGCNWVDWGGEDWVVPGEEAVFRIARNRLSYGQKVVDVLGWYGPYPFGDSIRVGGSEESPEGADEWLSAREFASLQAKLPRYAGNASRADELIKIENAFRGGPTRWLERFPGPEVVRRARAWADSGGAS